jgi:hypothetical protein
MKVGEKEDKEGCIDERTGVSIKDSMEGFLVASSRCRVRRLCLYRMSRNRERRRKMRMRSVKPRMYPSFEVEGRWCSGARMLGSAGLVLLRLWTLGMCLGVAGWELRLKQYSALTT